MSAAMSEPEENEFEPGIEIYPGVFYGGCEEYAQNKIEARMRLLAMPKEEAQKLASQTIYPQLWEVRPEEIKWEGSSLSFEDEDDETDP